MNRKSQPALVASLILNVVLIILLILSNTGKQRADETVAQATSLPTNTPAEQTPVIMVVTATPTITPTPQADEPTEASIPPTPNPTPTSLPSSPTPTLPPAAAPTPLPTVAPSPSPVPGPAWLRYANLFRDQANLPQVTENPEWSEGARLHSVFMVNTDNLWHGEDPNSPWFTQAGTNAGENGNIAASDWGGEPADTWAINYWISAPFHALPFLDPELHSVGYGEHRQEVGTFVLAATMDIKRGQGELPSSVSYPVMFPRDGGETWILKHGLPEFPNPLTSCPGFQRPVGPPIMLQIGPGDLIPSVTEHSLLKDGQPVDHCLFDETSYVNPTNQDTGRLLLDTRDAIVIMPRTPLEVGSSYAVKVVVNGQEISWSFTAVNPP